MDDLEYVEGIAEVLRKRQWQWSVAESCTGGLIGGEITHLSGISDVFVGGIISYSNALKMKLLGVAGAVLEQHGAVSQATAEAMVRGTAAVCDVEAAISVTGVAGPGGGTSEKPVGLVFIGTFVNGQVLVTENHFEGNREKIRKMTVTTALKQLYFQLCEQEEV